MQAGVTVWASAPGIVKGARDGMADIAQTAPNAPDITDRDCGNGVLIEHADGWQTQYCHMKQGSITVRPGDPVALGAPLGQVGLSGRTEFPHLHVTVRHNGETIDPFNPDPKAACGSAAQQLWVQALPYRPGGLINIGFSQTVPTFDEIKQGLPPPDLTTTAPALVIWAHVFGGRTGDVIALAITGPQGQIIRDDVPLERTQARLFRAVGKKLTAAGWPAGSYTGTVALMRDGVQVDQMETTLTLRD